MSVLVSHRKESKFEVIAFSIELRNLMIGLMQRNFGIKNVNAIARRRYVFGKDDTESPSKYHYLIRNYKERIDTISSQVITNLRAANSIYPNTYSEYEERRTCQTKAIANCEQLICELQEIVNIFEVDVNIYKKYINAIDRETVLIKRWRRSDNKLIQIKE